MQVLENCRRSVGKKHRGSEGEELLCGARRFNLFFEAWILDWNMTLWRVCWFFATTEVIAATKTKQLNNNNNINNNNNNNNKSNISSFTDLILTKLLLESFWDKTTTSSWPSTQKIYIYIYGTDLFNASADLDECGKFWNF